MSATGSTAMGRAVAARTAPRFVRTILELSVLGVGWLLGGNVGVGTALIAFSLGPVIHVAVRRFHLPVPAHSSEVLGE